MVFEHLESRVLLSAVKPLLDQSRASAALMSTTEDGNPYTYQVPQAIVDDATAAITASPGDVLANAANGLDAPQSQIDMDPAMQDVIAYHEALSLSIYPDSGGVPTVGYGFNLNDAQSAKSYLGVAAFDTMRADWANTLKLWRNWLAQNNIQHAKLNNGPTWKKFIAAVPASVPIEMTAEQAYQDLEYALPIYVHRAEISFGSQFYKLDRDPQIALVDMRYRGDTSTALAAQIRGTGKDNATNYIEAADDVVSSPQQREDDDSALMMHGTYPTSFNIDPLSIDVGDTQALSVTSEGSKGKGIILTSDQVQYSSDDTGIATVDGSGNVTGVSDGVTTVFESLTAYPTISAPGSVTVGNAAGSFNIPVDGGAVQLTGVAPGTPVSIKIEYSTTDENENGEGESLLIMDGNSDTVANDASYNATSVYSYTAQGITTGDSTVFDSLSAVSQGWDGDESAVVTATVQAAGAGLTSQQQAGLSTTSSDLDTSAAGDAAASYDLASDFPNDPGITSAAETNSVLSALASLDLDLMAVDPASPSYATIAKPVSPTKAIFSTAKSFVGVKNAKPLAAAINAVDLNLEEIIDYASAAYTTENRLSGATDAKSVKWEKTQLRVLDSYKLREAALLLAEPKLTLRETTQLDKAGLGQTAVSSTDVDNFEQTVDEDGLPAAFVTTLNELGVSSTTQQQIQQTLFAQNIDTASGTYDSILDSSALQADFKALGAVLRKK